MSAPPSLAAKPSKMTSKPRIAGSPLSFEAGVEPGTPIDLREYQKDKDIIRSFSKGFQESTSTSAAASMRLELLKLSQKIQDVKEKEGFSREMDNFYSLYTRFLDEKVKQEELVWNDVKSAENIVPYKSIPVCTDNDRGVIFNKLAVLKLNGGLGTTMGCVGPKRLVLVLGVNSSAIEVRDGMTFLDLTVRQIEELNTKVPLVLMNSFNTDQETIRIIQKYKGSSLDILTFNQSRYPRIQKDSLMPVPNDPVGENGAWYPPGHGDLFEALSNSGTLDYLLSIGKEYIFVSNVDNLGATVDSAILQHMITSGSEFLMEVTDKTKADIKGGTLIDYKGNIRLLEIAQVPGEHLDDFKSIKKFKIFNTNNLWISLHAIKRLVDSKNLKLEIIVNNKTSESGEKVIQLETAVGAAIKHFKGSHGINVPRSRFLPVKSTSDLFLITSDLYKLSKGELVINPKRIFGSIPLVKLGDHFKKVAHFLSRFQSPPLILELDHLTVTGDVTFGHDVVLQGTVIIVANHGSRIDIPSGAILHDKVVSGNLRILDH